MKRTPDPVLEAWLEHQALDAASLSAASDIVDVVPIPWPHGAPRAYAIELRCRGFTRDEAGAVREHDRFRAIVQFGPEHLRRVQPETLVRVQPLSAWHPNMRLGFVCMSAREGMGLTDIVHTLYEMLTYQLVTMTERNALNADACRWARANLERFPTERRALRRSPGGTNEGDPTR